MVCADLLQDYNVYTPVIDDRETDLIVEVKGRYDKVNVKSIGNMTTKSSIEVKLGKHFQKKIIDVLAIYHKPIGIAYLPIRKMGFPKYLNLAIHTAHNGQNKKRIYFYQFMRYPEYE